MTFAAFLALIALPVGRAEWFRPQPLPPRPWFLRSDERETPMTDIFWLGALAGITLLTTAFVALCERA